ncbi:MarR family winged helix-turn-helix transcriptional regulator [Hoyosella altamirensis]|uniref:DNA-binding MarR family transcriptional regulator n=1 Tax=Hoyosella altamirensis TaxID=616997 RepID=A0A839RJA1_9ACTN|nr:MarR family winged helix-turn-helix transcriptional regulator [Hoyosella altamirensis]MBB3036359.1 DNA-binding MarR family transcriptional regulator [Hoyosella altamirensis]
MAHALVPAEIADHTTCLLLRLGQVTYKLTEEALAPFGLRTRHYTVLKALNASGPDGQHALGTRLRIDPATMVSVVDDLESLSCAERNRDPLDRRRVLVSITDKGRDLIGRADTALVELNDTLLVELTGGQRGALHEILATLCSGETMPAAFDQLRG